MLWLMHGPSSDSTSYVHFGQLMLPLEGLRDRLALAESHDVHASLLWIEYRPTADCGQCSYWQKVLLMCEKEGGQGEDHMYPTIR